MRIRRFSRLVVVTAVLATATAVHTSAQTPSRPMGAQAVVTRYFTLLNAGMRSGDFSALATVFAPDGVVPRQYHPPGDV